MLARTADAGGGGAAPVNAALDLGFDAASIPELLFTVTLAAGAAPHGLPFGVDGSTAGVCGFSVFEVESTAPAERGPELRIGGGMVRGL